MKSKRLIRWRKEANLKLSDFKGKPPPETTHGAFTRTWLDYDFKLDIQKDDYRFTEIKVKAYFVPFDSWIKDSLDQIQKDVIIKHEQGHFDIAEEYARKIEVKIQKELMGNEFLCVGTRKQITEAARNQIEKILIDGHKEWRESEKIYDLKTNRGRDLLAQIEFLEKFDKLRQP